MTSEMEYICDNCRGNRFKKKRELSGRLGIKWDDIGVVECLQCGLYSLFPLPDDKRISKIYNGYIEKGNRIDIERIRVNEIYPKKAKKISVFSPHAKSILDLGAGLGGFVSVMRKSGYDVTGVEMQECQVELAKKIYNAELIQARIEGFLLSNQKKFDVVNLHHVLEHLRHPSEILVLIKKALGPSGILLIEVPNQFFVFPKELYFKLKIITEPFPYNPLHHFYFFSPVTIKNLLNRYGYKILFLNKDLDSNGRRFISKVKIRAGKILNLNTNHNIEIIAGVDDSGFD